MFFRRRSRQRASAAERVANPRIVDVRLTAIEPETQNIRQTFDATDRADVSRKIIESAELEGQDQPDLDETGVRHFRPRYRPPMAVLKILDDNQKNSDTVRVRTNRFIIGRDEGDVTIPHDKLMSGRHAEVSRRFEDGDYVWHLHDLRSRNGSFVKIDFIRLRAGDELILGSATYVFEESRQSPPRLVEIGSRQPRQVEFKQDDFWIGRNRKHCVPVLTDDPLLDEKHARIQHVKERWCIMASRSTNGVWARVDQVQLSNGTRFQLGEQRFQLLVP